MCAYSIFIVFGHVVGYEKNAEACKQEIEEIIHKIQSLFTQEITLDARVHSRLIGPKGRTVRKVCSYFINITVK